MKKLVLLLLVSNFAMAQPDVEIRLVDANVGTPLTFNMYQENEYTTSNDDGLNAILNQYGAYSYEHKGGHHYGPYYLRMVSILGTFPPEFIADLLAYSSVIESVHISDHGSFYDALDVTLNDSAVGVATGFNNGFVVTNDAGLNQIFQTYSVFQYELMAPGYPAFNKWYQLTCNCDANLLAQALSDYSSVITSTYPSGAAYLNNPLFEKPQVSISPNPFTDIFTVQTGLQVKNYLVADISGKIIIQAHSKSELDIQSSKLSIGMYILNLLFENGQTGTYKLVKK